jgi:hypothetical protein
LFAGTCFLYSSPQPTEKQFCFIFQRKQILNELSVANSVLGQYGIIVCFGTAWCGINMDGYPYYKKIPDQPVEALV